MTNVREAAVAGLFYPSAPDELKQDIEDLLIACEGGNKGPRVLIVPHAGYMYSGHVAAVAYRLMNASVIRRVILLGPSHRVALDGCAVPTSEHFKTPLGMIKLDTQACQSLVDEGLASYNDKAHQFEHSLEVQLPFLQFCLNEFTLLPIVVGYVESREVIDVLQKLYVDSEDLIVISTDLSHFHPYQEAIELDQNSINKILNLNAILKSHNACGSYAVNGLLGFVSKQNEAHKIEGEGVQNNTWQIQLLKYANSGDVGGNKQEVVGYASFAIY